MTIMLVRALAISIVTITAQGGGDGSSTLLLIPASRLKISGTLRWDAANQSLEGSVKNLPDGAVLLRLTSRNRLFVHQDSEVLASIKLKRELIQLLNTKKQGSLIKYRELSESSQLLVRQRALTILPDYPILPDTCFVLTPVSKRKLVVGKFGVSTPATPFFYDVSSRKTPGAGKKILTEMFGSGKLKKFDDEKAKAKYTAEILSQESPDCYSFDPMRPRKERLSVLAGAAIDLRNWLTTEDARLQDEIESKYFSGSEWMETNTLRRVRNMEEFKQLCPSIYQDERNGVMRAWKNTGAASEQEAMNLFDTATITAEHMVGVHFYAEDADRPRMITTDP